VNLDIGCSSKKLDGYFGMDLINQPGVDYVHDLEVAPWPMDSGIVALINASHILEHLKPWKFFDVMNEAWRVMEPGGKMTIRTPYGAAYAFDPTHCLLFQESSFFYLDPQTRYWEIYKPKPWEIVNFTRDESTLELKTILRKRAE
jgi:hypothetical protein